MRLYRVLALCKCVARTDDGDLYINKGGDGAWRACDCAYMTVPASVCRGVAVHDLMKDLKE